MNSKKKLLALVLSLVILIGGASVLYTKLSKREEEKGNTNQLLTTSGSNTWVGENVTVEKDDSKTDNSESKKEDNILQSKPSNSANESSSQKEESSKPEPQKPNTSQVTPSQSKPQTETEKEPSESEDTPQKPQRNEPKAPNFTVYDANGKAVKLSDYIGKPIVLNFWASWCGPCGREMPDFNQKYLAYGDKVHFLMVNLTVGRETVTTAQKFISESGYLFPILFDKDENAANAYSIYSIPSTFFIDSEGYIMARATGAISADVLQQGIDMIK